MKNKKISLKGFIEWQTKSTLNHITLPVCCRQRMLVILQQLWIRFGVNINEETKKELQSIDILIE